jgi:hypothetical protein
MPSAPTPVTDALVRARIASYSVDARLVERIDEHTPVVAGYFQPRMAH